MGSLASHAQVIAQAAVYGHAVKGAGERPQSVSSPAREKLNFERNAGMPWYEIALFSGGVALGLLIGLLVATIAVKRALR